jgi:hypothetical protein
MNEIDARKALEELARRKKRRLQAKEVVDAVKSELFGKQREVWEYKSDFKAVLCPRRSGKSNIWPRLSVGEALFNDNALICIWGATRSRVKQMMWDAIVLLCARQAVKVKTHETDLTIKFENGSEIRLLGADRDHDIQKKRGDKVAIHIVLEAQLYGPILAVLVNDVAGPSLMDERQRGLGHFYLEGSPGPVCVGLWYEITGRNDVDSQWDSIGNSKGEGLGWRCFRWMMADNPHMPHAQKEIDKEKARQRWTDTHPTYRREYLGCWVNDFEKLFYRYDQKRNGFTTDETKPWGPGWTHVLGWDLGSRDDMALVVWAYHEHKPDLYEAYSWKKPGALSNEVMAQIDALEKRGFNFVAKVADTQGGGKMYVEDVMSRYSQVFEPAKKSEKYAHVSLLNDDFLTGHIKVQIGSPLETELRLLPIDPDWDRESATKPPTEAQNFPNHCCDAALYSFRKAKHYWHKPEPKIVKPGTEEYTDLEEQHLMDAATQKRQEEYESRYDQDFYGEGDLDEW